VVVAVILDRAAVADDRPLAWRGRVEPRRSLAD
jgi:hypothetical protein